eukprot:7555-Heterococcus_DN1.PRE.2
MMYDVQSDNGVDSIAGSWYSRKTLPRQTLSADIRMLKTPVKTYSNWYFKLRYCMHTLFLNAAPIAILSASSKCAGCCCVVWAVHRGMELISAAQTVLVKQLPSNLADHARPLRSCAN